MDPLPRTEMAPAVRTDFSDEESWKKLRAAIQEPSEEGFAANLEFVDDRKYQGLTVEQLLLLLPAEWEWSFAFLIDEASISDDEHSVLVVDLSTEPGRTFRVIPSQVWGVENNLSIANMDFGDFADAVGADGVFRGWS